MAETPEAQQLIDMRLQYSATAYVFDAEPMPKEAYIDYARNPEVLAGEIGLFARIAASNGLEWPPATGSAQDTRLKSLIKLVEIRTSGGIGDTSAFNGITSSGTGAEGIPLMPGKDIRRKL